MDYRYNRFERFCARHEKWGIKNLMLYITAISVVMYLLARTDFGVQFIYEWLTFVPSKIMQGQIWRIVTFAFLPSFDNIFSFALSTVFYYWVGQLLEAEWGRLKFTIFIASGILLVALYGGILGIWLSTDSGLAAMGLGAVAELLDMQFADMVSMYMLSGMHYMYMSMFLAYAILEPNGYMRLYFIIPIKTKWLAIIDLAYILTGVFRGGFPFNMFPLVALANVAVFFGGRFIRHFRSNVRARSKRIDFQKKVKEIKKRGYTHRCVVCGKTDVTHPNEEFRYCSKCAGYACYCSEHIMDHTHIK